MTGNRPCEWVDQRLDAYLDDALPRPEAGQVAVHVHGCARCREALAQAQRIRDALNAWPQSPCPEAVVHAVHQRTRRRPRRWQAWAAAAVIGAIALGLSFSLPNQQSQPSALELQRARADLQLALGYIAETGRIAGRGVGAMVSGAAMRPIRSGLDIDVRYPLTLLNETPETRS